MCPTGRIPLFVTSAAGLDGWSSARRRDTLLLDMTGTAAPGEGWLQVLPFPSGKGFLRVSSSSATGATETGNRSTAFGQGGSGHGNLCACCTARPALAARLLALFQERARGQMPFFHRVVLVVLPMQIAEVTAALRAESLTNGLFNPETAE